MWPANLKQSSERSTKQSKPQLIRNMYSYLREWLHFPKLSTLWFSLRNKKQGPSFGLRTRETEQKKKVRLLTFKSITVLILLWHVISPHVILLLLLHYFIDFLPKKERCGKTTYKEAKLCRIWIVAKPMIKR